jgi:hypothetical protein
MGIFTANEMLFFFLGVLGTKNFSFQVAFDYARCFGHHACSFYDCLVGKQSSGKRGSGLWHGSPNFWRDHSYLLRPCQATGCQRNEAAKVQLNCIAAEMTDPKKLLNNY